MLLAIMQAPSPVPRKAADSPASTTQNVERKRNASKAPTPPSVGINSQVKAKSPKRNSSEQSHENTEQPVRVTELPPVTVTGHKRDWADWGYWGFNLLLVGVGVAQAWLLFGTLRAIRRQGVSMRDAVQATNDGTEAMKNSQCALMKMDEPAPSGDEFCAQAVNRGATAARIVGSWRDRIDVLSESEMPAPPKYGDTELSDAVMVMPGEPFLIEPVYHLDKPLKTPAHSAVIFGRIRYRDVFGRGFETRYCYKHVLAETSVNDADSSFVVITTNPRNGHFVVYGPKGYNVSAQEQQS